jgi:hypothetical protein
VGSMAVCFKCSKNIEAGQTLQHGLHSECFVEWFALPSLGDFINLAAKAASNSPPTPGGFSRLNSSFFHGKFKKYSAELGALSYILKIQQKDYPELPAMEYLCNQIARTMKLEVPDFYFISFHGENTFVTKNFVRKGQKENLIHIYRFLNEGQKFDCETLIAVIEEETKRLREVERFIELCLFDSLIGNHDRHGRNIGILQTAEKQILAPFYDNPSYLGIEIETLLLANHSPRGSIATAETGEPTMKDYVLEFKRLGKESVVSKFAKNINLESVLKLVGTAFMSENRRTAFSRIIKERYAELTNAL